RALAEKGEAKHAIERRQKPELLHRRSPLLGGDIRIVFWSRSDGGAFDAARIRNEAVQEPRDAKWPAAEAARDDVRKLVAEHRVGEAGGLQVHFAPPRLGNVRVRRAHQVA